MRGALGHDDVFDVVIIGGGPAGAAAALSLRQLRPRYRVGIVEPSRYDSWRAGETLAPGCQELLQSLGCWDGFRNAGFLEAPGTRAVWGDATPYENEFFFSLRGNGWHVDRARFDALLCRDAQYAGAELISHSRLCGVERNASGYHLRLENSADRGAPHRTIRARFVIDASGRQASFASRCGARPVSDDRLIGVCGLLTAASSDAATLVEAQPDGWWYSSLLPEGRMIVAWMSDADLIRDARLCDAQRWLTRLRATEWTAQRTGDTLLTPLRVWTAHSQRLNHFHGDDWVAAGDAATSYDPLSSLGILKALRSGKIASFVAIDRLEGRDSFNRYDRFVAGEYAGYCETRRWFYSQEQRWPDAPFWERRTKGDHTKWQTVRN